MSYLIKTGGTSIVLGEGHFSTFVPIKKNKLVKITKINTFNNEFRIADKVRSINNYAEHFIIPDAEVKTIKPSDEFYKHVEKLVKDYNMGIFGYDLLYFYVDNAGDLDMIDSIEELKIKYDFSIWKSYKFIMKFAVKIMEAINYLHQNKICHLDIKPENIMINRSTKQFKLIDFGFAFEEPFTEFIQKPRGTPGYFPQYFVNDTVTPYLPKINANDRIRINCKFPIELNMKLVYKIDSYCLGRTLHHLKYIYKDNRYYECFNTEKKMERRVDKLIEDLMYDNVFHRKTIKECLIKYYSGNL